MPKEVMNVRISILPKTTLGKWSVILAAACIVLLVLLVVGWPGVERGSLVAHIRGFGCIISGIAALVTGLISIIKTKERSILAFSAVVVTGLVTLFFLIMFISEELLGM